MCLRIRGSRDEVSRVAMEEYDLFYQEDLNSRCEVGGGYQKRNCRARLLKWRYLNEDAVGSRIRLSTIW